MPEIPFEHLPRTQAILSHFEGVQRLENLGVVPPEEQPPYPIDDAAVHHLFEGGWVWVLRFNNGLTSAGIAATETLARELGFEQPQGAWDRLQQKFPTIGDQFRQAKSHFPLQHLPQLSFRAAQVTGANWALLPSAAGFLDPLFSTGFTLTLLGIDRIAKAIQQHWGTDRFAECLTQYARQTTAELLATERLLAACYAAMGNFPVFASLARLYFAPVSFAEIAWRLGHPERAASFLLHDHPSFGPGFRNCCAEALQARGTADASRDAGSVLKSVLQAIAPVDIIGLSDLSRKNWYPAGRDDLLKGADKLGVSAEAMESFLNR